MLTYTNITSFFSGVVFLTFYLNVIISLQKKSQEWYMYPCKPSSQLCWRMQHCCISLCECAPHAYPLEISGYSLTPLSLSQHFNVHILNTKTFPFFLQDNYHLGKDTLNSQLHIQYITNTSVVNWSSILFYTMYSLILYFVGISHKFLLNWNGSLYFVFYNSCLVEENLQENIPHLAYMMFPKWHGSSCEPWDVFPS